MSEQLRKPTAPSTPDFKYICCWIQARLCTNIAGSKDIANFQPSLATWESQALCVQTFVDTMFGAPMDLFSKTFLTFLWVWCCSGPEKEHQGRFRQYFAQNKLFSKALAPLGPGAPLTSLGMRQSRLRLCRSTSGDMSAWLFHVTPFQPPVKAMNRRSSAAPGDVAYGPLPSLLGCRRRHLSRHPCTECPPAASSSGSGA